MKRSLALEVAVERALVENYLVEASRWAEIAALPPHPLWQGPLLVDARGAEEEIERRILHAGSLWLGAFDITPHNVLVVTNGGAGSTYVFQRVQGPRGLPLTIGPIAGELVAEGVELGPNGIKYRELRAAIPSEELEQLAWIEPSSIEREDVESASEAPARSALRT